TGAFPRKLLNIGYRATGPMEQLRILAHAKRHYRLEGLVWLLTENDILDDLYLRTRDPSYWATRLNIFFLRASLVFGRIWVTLEYLLVLSDSFALSHAAATHASDPAAFCESVRSADMVLRPGVPVTVFAIPHGTPAE